MSAPEPARGHSVSPPAPTVIAGGALGLLTALAPLEKRGRERFCRLDSRGLERAEAWIHARRRLWDSRLAALDAYLGAEKRRRHR